jgi:hypothetical protein
MRKANNDTPAAYFSLMIPGLVMVLWYVLYQPHHHFIESLSLTHPNPCLNPVTLISLLNKRLTRPRKAPGNPGRYRLGSLLFHSTRTTPTSYSELCLLSCKAASSPPLPLPRLLTRPDLLDALSNRHWPTNCPLLLKLHLYLAMSGPRS